MMNVGVGVSFVPSLEQNKEYRFLYALNQSVNNRTLDPNIEVGTSPKEITTDIEVTVQGKDSSTYAVDFNSEIVDSMFLESMQNFGYKLDFISASKYLKKQEFTVWFSEVQQ